MLKAEARNDLLHPRVYDYFHRCVNHCHDIYMKTLTAMVENRIQINKLKSLERNDVVGTGLSPSLPNISFGDKDPKSRLKNAAKECMEGLKPKALDFGRGIQTDIIAAREGASLLLQGDLNGLQSEFVKFGKDEWIKECKEISQNNILDFLYLVIESREANGDEDPRRRLSAVVFQLATEVGAEKVNSSIMKKREKYAAERAAAQAIRDKSSDVQARASEASRETIEETIEARVAIGLAPLVELQEEVRILKQNQAKTAQAQRATTFAVPHATQGNPQKNGEGAESAAEKNAQKRRRRAERKAAVSATVDASDGAQPQATSQHQAKKQMTGANTQQSQAVRQDRPGRSQAAELDRPARGGNSQQWNRPPQHRERSSESARGRSNDQSASRGRGGLRGGRGRGR
jgi:hypothetical protein